MKRIICIIAIAVITGTFIFLAVKTQMTVSVDPVTGLQYDGFGRELFPAPYLSVAWVCTTGLGYFGLLLTALSAGSWSFLII